VNTRRGLPLCPAVEVAHLLHRTLEQLSARPVAVQSTDGHARWPVTGELHFRARSDRSGVMPGCAMMAQSCSIFRTLDPFHVSLLLFFVLPYLPNALIIVEADDEVV